MKFNAYGRLIEVVRISSEWRVYYSGNEGKKRTAYDIMIPNELNESEIKNYLEDILHEWARPSNNQIVEIKKIKNSSHNESFNPDVAKTRGRKNQGAISTMSPEFTMI